MELDELKQVWQKEKKEMENRIEIDDKLIRELTFDKSKGAFEKLLTTAIMGRNLALVYAVISFSAAFMVQSHFTDCILAIFGGLAMLFSFFQHLPLKRPDFDKMSTVELQKAISKFRMHTAQYSKYDISIVILWFGTLLPLYFNYILQFKILPPALIIFLILVLVVSILLSQGLYKKWDKKLKESEELLQRTIEFEKQIGI